MWLSNLHMRIIRSLMFTITIMFVFIIKVIVCEDQRELNDSNECRSVEENKYSAESNTKFLHILKSIESAKNEYKPCAYSNCSCYSSVITENLKLYKRSGITQEMLNAVRTKGTKYQIINSRLYRDKDCMFPSRCAGIEHFLLKLAPNLPDIEVIINTRDWPQLRSVLGKSGPIFSFSKTKDYADIMYPAWSFWEGGPAISLYPTGIGRWDKHRQSLLKAAEKFPWDQKENKAFFRGSRTSSERDSLVLLSRDEPHLVDAKYTKNQAWKSDADTLHAVPASEVPFEDHCKYKYLFNFRGVAASFRFKHLFLCKSLVFHVGDEWLEFFYPLLKPWVHYIPVDTKASESDLKLLIEFARKNDQIVKEIAERGFQIIWDHLRMKDVVCYWNKVIRRYAKLLKFQPVLDADLIEIKNKNNTRK